VAPGEVPSDQVPPQPPAEAAPAVPAEQFPVQDVSPAVTDVSGLGATRGTEAFAANMLGDSLYTAGTIYFANEETVNRLARLCGGGATAGQVFGDDFVAASNPFLAGRLFRISENQSPLPQTRVYFNYHYFNDAIEVASYGPGAVLGAQQNLDVNVYTFGAEYAFLDQMASIQIQVPFATSLASEITNIAVDQGAPGAVPINAPSDTDFGNISFALKGVLYQEWNTAFAAGLALTLPTAPDLFYQTVTPGGAPNQSLQIDNETVFLSPFIGNLWTGHPVLFSQAYMQLHIPLGEDPFTYRADPNGPAFTGDLEADVIVQSDVSFGVWLYNDPAAWMSSLAALFELHGAASFGEDFTFLDDDNVGAADGLVEQGRFSYLNGTVGAQAAVGLTTIRPAFVFPITGVEVGVLDHDDRPFDFEFSLQINRFF
jgi:hypothetical protein